MKYRPKFYKGKIVEYKDGEKLEGQDYVIGKLTVMDGVPIIIMVYSKNPNLDRYKYLPSSYEVIYDSLCINTGVFDSQNVLVCLFDVLEDNRTKELYIVFGKSSNCKYVKLIPYYETVKLFNNKQDELRFFTDIENSVVSLKELNNYTEVNSLYDMNRKLFTILKDSIGNLGDKIYNFKRLINPGDIVYLSCGIIRVAVNSSRGILLVHPCNGEFLLLSDEYNTDLIHKNNSVYNVDKIYMCNKHADSYKSMKWITENNWAKLIQQNEIKWDWVRLREI
jgi:hypothetical protein